MVDFLYGNKSNNKIMIQYIDKDKIDKIIRNLWKEDDVNNSEHRIFYNKALQEVQCEIDNLEVKEMDLEKEIGKYLDANDIEFSHQIKLLDFARHFYELGMSVSNKE